MQLIYTNNHLGDDDEIAQLESRAASFNPATYWDDRKKLAMESPGLFNQSCSPSSSSATPTLAVAAASPSATRLSTTTTRLHNPYEGRPWCAKQLNETFENFLTRLPPSTTATTDQTPWIYVANPFIPREEDHGRRGGGGSGGEEQEAPSEFGAQIEGFMEGGAERLALLGDFLRTVEAKTGRGGLSKAVVNREVAKERDGAVNDVLMLAKMLKVRTGKVSNSFFLLFFSHLLFLVFFFFPSPNSPSHTLSVESLDQAILFHSTLILKE